MYCPSCGEELAEGTSFCSNCGAEIASSGEQPAAGATEAGQEGAAGGAARQQPGTTGRGDEQPKVAGGLDENVAGTLSYVLGFVTGLIFFLIEDDNDFVRFHAAQSMVVFGALFVLGIVVSIIQGALSFGGIAYVGWMVAALLGLFMLLVYIGSLVLWILLMVKAYNGERYALPIAGGFAENLA